MFLGCSTAPAGDVRDDLGRGVTLPPGSGRVVSLAPNVTELLIRLAGEGVLAGRTAWCPVSRAGAARIPVAGTMLRVEPERMVRLAPRLVFLSYEGSPPGIARTLSGLGIASYVVRIRSYEELVGSVGRMARVLRVNPEALLILLRKECAWLAERLAGKRLFFHIPGGYSPYTFGKETLLDDLLRVAGAINCGGLLAGRFPRPSLEQLLRLRIGTVVVLAAAESGEGRAARKFWSRLQPGIRLVYATESAFFRPGPGQ